MKPSERIVLLSEAVGTWLADTSGALADAINKTISENLFPEHDILFALDHIRESVNRDSLEKWAGMYPLEENRVPETVLCFHAGNLPLVGFQDVIATVLSGHRYAGKLSRKDPYLLASFIETLKYLAPETRPVHAINLDGLGGIKADRFLFSGSGKNAEQVLKLCLHRDLITQKTACLMRTAHASAAWFDPSHDEIALLTESIFQYGGKGCRSVASVFTPSHPEKLLGSLSRSFDAFENRNPITQKKMLMLDYRMAYNFAIGRPCARLGNILLECGPPDLLADNVATITQGNIAELEAFRDSAGTALQSVYGNDHDHGFEPIGLAQRPPIHWKPDGIDPLGWLLQEQKPGSQS